MGEPENKVGRPRKRDAEVANIAGAMGIVLTADIMTLDEIAGFPQLDGMRDKDKAILCLNACGFSQGFIARAMGMAQPSVCERLKVLDPERMFTLSPRARSAFITRLAESRGMEALAYITPEKLEDANADSLIRIADKAFDISNKRNQSKHKDVSVSKLDYMMKMIEDEADITEVKE